MAVIAWLSRLLPCVLLQKRCAVREQYKLDFDYYSREVKAMREKASANPAKLERKEGKLRNAETLLNAYSTDLFDAIRALLQQREVLLLPQLCQVGGGDEGVCCDAAVDRGDVAASPRTVPAATVPSARAQLLCRSQSTVNRGARRSRDRRLDTGCIALLPLVFVCVWLCRCAFVYVRLCGLGVIIHRVRLTDCGVVPRPFDDPSIRSTAGKDG